LDVARVEGSALNAAEQRLLRLQREGAEIAIVRDRIARGGQQRHDARLVALAGDAQHGLIRLARRQ